jgi:CheY-like chemotaxis protein
MSNAAMDAGVTEAKRPRVLVVEDEYLVALLVEDMLQTLGFQVVEIAPNIGAATTAAEAGDFDVAILDVNLNGAMSNPVAEILTRRKIPFIFATGYGKSGPHEHYVDAPSLQKPFEEADLGRALSAALGRA